jgi:hypothetical protein
MMEFLWLFKEKSDGSWTKMSTISPDFKEKESKGTIAYATS